MIWQWIIITVCAVLAAWYLVGVIRKTINQPFCSDCPGCRPKKKALK
jgi:hypothetical protein